MLELTLRHDGSAWVAEGGGLRFRGETLSDLDEAVRAELNRGNERGDCSSGGESASGRRVRMCFDNGTLPDWVRPYSQHYFNRIIHL